MEKRYALIVLGAAATCLTVFAQGVARELPPSERGPRTREEWQAELASQQSLADSWEEAYPEYAEHLQALLERIESLHARYLHAPVCDPDMADQLIAELYVDAGHPRLNSVAQDQIIDPVIRDIAGWPEDRLPPEARQRLVAGLLAYVEAGGGQFSPAAQASVAAALDALAAHEVQARQVVEMLLEDAFAWAEEIDSDIQRKGVYAECARHWGDVFWLRVYEAQSHGDLPAKRSKRYERAVAALARLLSERPTDEVEFSKAVRAATDSALVRLKEPALNDDLTSRLLVVYRCLLERRPMVPNRVSEYIADRLLWLARDSQRLRTEGHWRLWGQAVAALRPSRAPDNLKSYILATLRVSGLKGARREAMERLADLASQP